jgi:HK97 family phage portal protein
MRSALSRLLNQVSTPVPYAAPGRYSLTMFTGQNALDTYMRCYGTHGTVFAIVSLLATSVAKPEWHLYRKQPVDGRVRYTTGDHGSDQRTEVVNHAALSLIRSPNPFQTTFEFLEASQQHIDLTGECFWILDNSHGQASFPTNMWLVSPAKMDVIPSPENYIQGYVYNGPSGEKIPLDLTQVIHTKMANPLDPYRGIGPIQAVLAKIDGMRYADEYNRNFFLNNAAPDGIIQVDKRLSDSEWDEFQDRWRESHQGVSRSHRVAMLENGMQWVANSMTHRDMEFQQLLETMDSQIMEAFRMHKSLLGLVEDVNKANAQTAEEVFGAYHLLPRLDRLKNTLNSKLLPLFGSTGSGVEFDYDNPLPDDREADNAELLAKAQAVTALVNAGYDQHDVLEICGVADMGLAEKPTQQPALPPGWVAAPPAAPDSTATPGASDEESSAVKNKLLNKNAAGKVIQLLTADYPPSAMAWVYHAAWNGPVTVPLAHIDPDMTGFDAADPDHVQDFVDRIQAGKKIKPVILVKRPDEAKLLLVDGHHRFIASSIADLPVNAFVATVNADHGAWESMHDAQYATAHNTLLTELRDFIKSDFTQVNGKEVLNGSHPEHQTH